MPASKNPKASITLTPVIKAQEKFMLPKESDLPNGYSIHTIAIMAKKTVKDRGQEGAIVSGLTAGKAARQARPTEVR
jgi:hypothetical protein